MRKAQKGLLTMRSFGGSTGNSRSTSLKRLVKMLTKSFHSWVDRKRDVENTIRQEIDERALTTNLFGKTVSWFPHLEPLSVVLFRILQVDEEFECITANLSRRDWTNRKDISSYSDVYRMNSP
jgi:hypothetical protein